MNRHHKYWFHLILSLVTCLFVINASHFSLPQLPAIAQSVESNQPLAFRVAQHLQAAQAVTQAPNARSQKFVAVMTRDSVVPNAVGTSAFGAAGAVLTGNRLIIRGDFSNLSSPLRDFATDPTNPPNPNITSAVHIHQGAATANGPFQLALTVQPGADQRSGRLQGDYTLSDEQLQALANGMLYVDLHTKQNRGGELRGILKPY
jgi:hypothetical protein